jgi:predicted enzyme related to lactoylglutathione lyase
MSDRKLRPGKFVWFELISSDAKKARVFYSELLGWKIRAFPMGNASYDMVFTGDTPDTMIGGFAARPRAGEPSRWISYVSVEDVDAAAEATAANGGKILEAPSNIPGIARTARIADPQGAELALFKRVNGDAPDTPIAPPGGFFWNELHTTDPTSALSFYEKVLGFSHRAMGMGPDATYYILSRDGVGRGGVTSHLPAGVPPHWLPYIAVEDPDATLARARTLGASIPVGPTDIPGVGRFGVLADPTGAVLAVMKPLPMEHQP